MNVLLLGASGATGKLVLNELINQNYNISIIVRNKEKIDTNILNNKSVEIIEANILDISKDKLKDLMKTSDVCISCLGHNISFKGIFGEPKKLVTNSVKRICELIEEENKTPTTSVFYNPQLTTSASLSISVRIPCSFSSLRR